jgi:hypothetical protein
MHLPPIGSRHIGDTPLMSQRAMRLLPVSDTYAMEPSRLKSMLYGKLRLSGPEPLFPRVLVGWIPTAPEFASANVAVPPVVAGGVTL